MTAVRALTCPACGGQIEIKAAGYTVAVACQHCGSALDVSRPEVDLITRYNEAVAPLTLPLGRRGTLEGVEWEVIGYLERSDGEADWNEYLLFNPYAGYRWLIENGHEWQLGMPLLSRPQVLSETQLFWRDARFSRDYEPVTTETKKAVGEFYWRVQRGVTVEATSWSRYGEMVSSEWTADELNWTLLKPATERDILHAFNLAPPEESEPAADRDFWNLLSPRGGRLGKSFAMVVVTLMASLIVFGLTAIGAGTGSPSAMLVLDIDAPPKGTVIGTITVDRPYGFVIITARGSDFTNKWVELDYTLVSLDTQRAYFGSDTLEYYTGRDSDGTWTEGSRWLTTRFGEIPRGRYEVSVEASARSWRSGSSYDSDGGWAGDAPVVVGFMARPAGMQPEDLLIVVGPLVFLPLFLWLIGASLKENFS